MRSGCLGVEEVEGVEGSKRVTRVAGGRCHSVGVVAAEELG